ncbi:MAG: hypothetical protein M3R72_11135 [Bacteroidota bacterium]|nr:hypothetical protein [Bacteroidota bacterium]
MDYLIHKSKRNKIKLFQEFHTFDFIPYSIALLILAGIPYIMVLFIEVTKLVK